MWRMLFFWCCYIHTKDIRSWEGLATKNILTPAQNRSKFAPHLIPIMIGLNEVICATPVAWHKRGGGKIRKAFPEITPQSIRNFYD